VLPKKYRLQDYEEIETVKKKGQLLQAPLFGLLIYPPSQKTTVVNPWMKAKNSASAGFRSAEVRRRYHERKLVELHFKSGQLLPRFTFIVSTKVSKKAVQRNYLRRVYSEAVKFLLPKVKAGDYLFLIKKNSLGRKMPEIKEQLIVAFSQRNLLKSESN